ncbi:MAG: hypothetical protein O7A03_08980 [Alphaproteobacteria bacterium]|nr:hypothetical protein [Alphaproteobacteria bacterium]
MSGQTAYRIVNLLDAPVARTQLIDAFIAEWDPWYRPQGDGDAAADLAECRDGERLPICLAALDFDAKLIAVAALRPQSMGEGIGA